MSKGIIYYSDCLIEEPIKSAVQKRLLESGLPIVSCTLKPMNFGTNIVLNRERGFITYMMQIGEALQASTASYVWFCEHDCLYPKSHFDFTPLRDDIFYYNVNVWRWLYGSDTAITYDRLISLSGLCCNRLLALDHYKRRIAKAETMPPERNTLEPVWARKWGYEPGTKRMGNGGFSDEECDTWRSPDPIIDIRHYGTISKAKVTLDSFKHQPTGWKEIPVTDLGVIM